MSRVQERLFWQMGYASTARYASQLLLMIRGFMLALLLGPEGFGIWTSMRLVLAFAIYADGGAQSGMLQQATHADGAGDGARAAKLRRVGATFSFGGALLMAAVVLAISSLAEPTPGVASAWRWFALLVAVHNIWLYFEAVMRSRRKYARVSSLTILVAMLSTSLGVAAATIYGLTGFLVAAAGSYCITIAAAWLSGQRFPKPICSRPIARELLESGSPILASHLLSRLMWNVDKIFIYIVGGNVALGIYALQSHITNALMLGPAGVADVLFPHLRTEMGRQRSSTVASKYLLRGVPLLTRLMCPVLAVVFLALHLPIRWMMPEYIATIGPGRVLSIAMFFPIAGIIPEGVVVAFGKQRKLAVISAVAVMVAAAAVTAAHLLGGGLVGVALGATAGLLVRSGLVLGSALKLTRIAGEERVRFLGQLAAIFGLTMSLVLAADWIIPDAANSLPDDLLRTLLRCGIVLAVLIPWALGGWKAEREAAIAV